MKKKSSKVIDDSVQTDLFGEQSPVVENSVVEVEAQINVDQPLEPFEQLEAMDDYYYDSLCEWNLDDLLEPCDDPFEKMDDDELFFACGLSENEQTSAPDWSWYEINEYVVELEEFEPVSEDEHYVYHSLGYDDPSIDEIPRSDEDDDYLDQGELLGPYDDPFEEMDYELLISVCGITDDDITDPDQDYGFFERTLVSDEEFENTDWSWRVKKAWGKSRYNRHEWSSRDEDEPRSNPTPEYSKKPVAEQSNDEWIGDYNIAEKVAVDYRKTRLKRN